MAKFVPAARAAVVQSARAPAAAAAASHKRRKADAVIPRVQRHDALTTSAATPNNVAGLPLPVVLPPSMQSGESAPPAAQQHPPRQRPAANRQTPGATKRPTASRVATTKSAAKSPSSAAPVAASRPARVVHSPLPPRTRSPQPQLAQDTEAQLKQSAVDDRPIRPAAAQVEQYELTAMRAEPHVGVLNVFGAADQPPRPVLRQSVMDPIVTTKAGNMRLHPTAKPKSRPSPLRSSLSSRSPSSQSRSSTKSILKPTAPPPQPIRQVADQHTTNESVSRHDGHADSAHTPRLSSPSPARDVTRHLPSPEPYHSVSAILGNTLGSHHLQQQR